jgi:hypothetical protein
VEGVVERDRDRILPFYVLKVICQPKPDGSNLDNPSGLKRFIDHMVPGAAPSETVPA